jgi:hypothetical protein
MRWSQVPGVVVRNCAIHIEPEALAEATRRIVREKGRGRPILTMSFPRIGYLCQIILSIQASELNQLPAF